MPEPSSISHPPITKILPKHCYQFCSSTCTTIQTIWFEYHGSTQTWFCQESFLRRCIWSIEEGWLKTKMKYGNTTEEFYIIPFCPLLLNRSLSLHILFIFTKIKRNTFKNECTSILHSIGFLWHMRLIHVQNTFRWFSPFLFCSSSVHFPRLSSSSLPPTLLSSLCFSD